jgi:NAD(P)-dependent dehydrogenase (short-subunit alcohol dehydrogenase family)
MRVWQCNERWGPWTVGRQSGGDGRGIGEATVRRFVAAGANVAFCDRDGERGQRVVAELESAGAKVAFTQADVGNEAACLGFVNGAAQTFGRLDILVNNTGIRKYEKVDEASVGTRSLAST